MGSLAMGAREAWRRKPWLDDQGPWRAGEEVVSEGEVALAVEVAHLGSAGGGICGWYCESCG